MKLELKLLGRSDESHRFALQKLLESAPSYWKRIEGAMPARDAAAGVLQELPPGKDYPDKFVCLISLDGVAVACADLVRGYPDSETAMLGLLLVDESVQGRGIGRAAYHELEALARAWTGVRKMRIGVVGTNDVVLPFWKSRGFVDTGLRRPYESGRVVSETIVLEKIFGKL